MIEASEQEYRSMKAAINNNLDPGSLLVTMTMGQIRELIREELRTALDQHSTFGGLSPHPISDIKPFLSVKEAAELARLAVSTIRLCIRKGELRGQKVGRRIIISRGELERFLAGNSGKVTELSPSLAG